ncbi:MAG: YbgC/FadM family acyl-CoA thioesterase [Eubacterium sp.]|nr:YbgC/FadM family acyl-CoA thioesterase [Eubacterium sp.]
MRDYIHHVRYYETDKMGVTHHANYLRWMEDARIDFLDQAGCGYPACEARGLASPVTGYQCELKESTRFADEIVIRTRIEKYTGVRLTFAYEMRRPDGTPVADGVTNHCFINAEGRVISLKRAFPDLHELLMKQISKNAK